MKHIKQLFGLAAVLGLASSGLAQTTNVWFSLFDFEDANLDFDAVTNTAGFGSGTWTADSTDETIVDPIGGDAGSAGLKLNTQGNNLTFTPNAASTETRVLIDSDVYLVGSDSEPSGFDGGDVQTAVYLKNETNIDGETTNSVLCAYVAIDDSDNQWIDLAGVTVADNNWYHLRIEIDYTTVATPVARYYVNGILMNQKGGSATQFTIANYTTFGTLATAKVNSISFRGTGAVDNFAGWEVADVAAATLNVIVNLYEDQVKDTLADPEEIFSLASSTVVAGTPISAYILDNLGGKTISLINVISSSANTTNSYVVEYDSGYESSIISGINATIPTINSWTGDVIIDVFFGTSPDGGGDTGDNPYFTPGGDSSKPVLTIGGSFGEYSLEAGIAPIEFNSNGDFIVNIVSAGEFVTYTLHEVTDLGDDFDAIDAQNESITEVDRKQGGQVGTTVQLIAPASSNPNAFYRVKASW